MINTVRNISQIYFKSNVLYKLYHQMAMLKFPLPDLGEKIKQGTVKKLYVQQGDKVEQFQKIADVESDKQFTQITAPENGKIAKIYYQQSQVCKVGDLFMEIQMKSQNQPTKVESASEQSPYKRTQKQRNQGSNSQRTMKISTKHDVNWAQQILASSVVRIFAYTQQVDLTKISGSGKKGRILKQDIIAHSQNKDKQLKPVMLQQKKKKPQPVNKRITMNLYQKGMQKSMSQSNKIPHLYYFQSVDMSESQRMRQQMKQNSMKVTMMGIFTKTLSLALNKYPIMNSHYQPSQGSEYQYKIHAVHNVSLAIDSPNGLVAPNIKNVEKLSVLQIQQQLENLKNLADKSQLTKSNLQGGTICLSNIGTIGGVSACPLILYPQVCIIAIGKAIDKPKYLLSSSTVIKKKQIQLGLGCDHRVLDGATVARFASEWKNIMENPYIALASMR